MDEFNEIQNRFNEYLTNLGNFYEIGLNNIGSTKDKLDEFMKEFNELFIKLDVPGADAGMLNNIKNEIKENENLVEENKTKLDKVKIEKEKLLNKIVEETRKVSNEINNLNIQKDRESDFEKVKELRNKIEALENRKKTLLHEFNIINKGGKYTIIDNKTAKTKPAPNSPSMSPGARSTTPKENSTPKKPKPKAEIVEKSIKYYVQNNMLPNNIKPSMWQQICAELGIKARHTNIALSDEDFKKLRYSKAVHEASVRSSIESRHNKVIKEYETLIKKYQKLSSEMTAPELASEKANMDSIVSRLQVEKAEYETKIGDFGYGVENYFAFEQSVSSNVESKRAARVDGKLDKVEKDIKEVYSTLEEQKQELANSRSKFKKVIVNRRINKTMAKISRLQEKQGRLSTTQNMIINASTDRYIEKKNKEKARQLEEHRKMSEYAGKINTMNERKAALGSEIEDVSRDIESITGNRLRDKIDRLSLQASRRKLEGELRRLKNKQGMTIMANQFRQTISSSLGR